MGCLAVGESAKRSMLWKESSSLDSTVSTRMSISEGSGVVLASFDGEGKEVDFFAESSALMALVSFAI